MPKLKLLILVLILSPGLFAQEKKGSTSYSISFNSYFSSGNDLPFWLTSNHNGIFARSKNNQQLIQAGFLKGYEIDSTRKWNYAWGADLVTGVVVPTDLQVIQYWFGIRHKWLTVKAGAQSDPVLYSGLSSTNGNLDRSNNARPLPGISLSTSNYVPFFFWKKWFSVKAEFEEKFFSDHAFVTDAHLHHKSLYSKALLSKNWIITAGMEHYVLWGGTSSAEGEMPGWNQYFNYILGQNAGPGALRDDRLNRAGNQLGIYSLEIKKGWDKSTVSFYWNHPFEDMSGMEMVNLQDGLWGFHINKKDQSSLITDIVYEYMYTMNQSGSVHHLPAPTPENPDRITGRGKDNYFDHFIYRSFTYYNQMMGTPLFIPRIGANGVADGFESTRMWMHHLGVKGALGSGFYWKTMLTLSRNFGTYNDAFPWSANFGPSGSSYPVPLDEFSYLFEFYYRGSKLPFQINAGIAGDTGSRFETRTGGYAGISFHF
jgi:hypothetical protein